MNVSRVGKGYVIRITAEEAAAIQRFMGIKIAMGNLCEDDTLELLGILVGREVEREKRKREAKGTI